MIFNFTFSLAALLTLPNASTAIVKQDNLEKMAAEYAAEVFLSKTSTHSHIHTQTTTKKQQLKKNN